MFRRLFENFWLKATDWLFRSSPIERLLLKSAFSVLILVFGAPPLLAEVLRLLLGFVPDHFTLARQTLNAFDGLILAICLLAILFALCLIFFRERGELKLRSKKRVHVIEARGLRDDDGVPLTQHISKDLEGQRIEILLDLRNRLDGKVINPESAVEEISAAHRSVRQHRNSVDRDQLVTVYGGLTSVPYTFLTGVLLDDEGDIVTYDWDRTTESWRALDMMDDGLAFVVSGAASLAGESEIVVALTFSYPIDDDDLETTFSYPGVRLALDGISSDAHWSKEKQNRLAQQFFETMKQLSALKVKRVHLVMAAPNSVVFNFGRRYDKRNLPEIVVYQYERAAEIKYPWGILMPVGGVDRAQIIYTS